MSQQTEQRRQNIIEGIQQQMTRCRELLEEYEAIGSAGIFGKVLLTARIREGEDAIASGDVIRMIAAYKSLEGCE